MHLVNVAIPTPVHKAFTYAVPSSLKIEPGTRIVVPFRKKRVVGICIEFIDDPPKGIDEKGLKEIEGVLGEDPILRPSLLKLVRWMSGYYCAPIGEVCRAALPARLMQLDAPRTTRPAEPAEIEPMPHKSVELNADQRRALGSMLDAIGEGGPRVFLLHGITGSGKTEVYLSLFEDLASRGRQGLLLVPEIGLTPQLTGRAAARFGGRVAVYHSGLTDAQRHRQWTRMRDGEADVVIGTRSALFAPLDRLGAIVVDEEHDGSYKQDEGVTYHGRDAAVMRAHIEGIAAVLGSATPSLESLENVKRGKYLRYDLTSRPGGASLPMVEIVDMRNFRRQHENQISEGMKKRRELQSLSPALYDAIANTLQRKEQVLLYIGRRGFAGALQCDSCGEVAKCPNCDIPLTLHVGRVAARPLRSDPGDLACESLVCHYCSYRIRTPGACGACGGKPLLPIGHGTERLEAEIKDFFPSARIARFDSDAVSNPAKRRGILDDMRKGRIDILVGTQMVTKGHDFPSITLVGVVAADLSLNLPDFRSAERTFQLITQVAGRAGRGKIPGRVIIQTRVPGHISFLAATNHDNDGFAEQELVHRRQLFYPPFSRLANIRLSSNREEAVARAAAQAADIMKRSIAGLGEGKRIALLGPAQAPIPKLRGRYRWQILVKAPGAALLTKLLAVSRSALEEAMPSGIRLSIDVDPVNLM